MMRISIAILLTLLGSSAHASGTSFSIAGHFIHVEGSRYCRSLSCISWSEGGSHRSGRDDNAAATPATAKQAATVPACPPVAAPAPAAPAPVAPETAAPRVAPVPVVIPPVPVPVPVPVKPAPVVQAQAPSTIELAAANVQAAPEVAAGRPKETATVEATIIDKPVETPDWSRGWSPKDAPAPKPTQVVLHGDDSPLGDWQTEGKKGLVRIEACGAALCGYILNEATNTTAETVLSNMKARTDAQWTGDIYSRASGNTYYAKMTFKRPGTLRVEACAIGRFLCSGNEWTRAPKPDELVTSRTLAASPKS